MRELRLKTHIFLVDDEDFDRINSYKWHEVNQGTRAFANSNGQTLPRFILNLNNPELIVDFKDRDNRNLQKENLEAITRKESWIRSGKRAHQYLKQKPLKPKNKFQCINCLSDFEAYRKDAKFCSHKCQGEFSKKEKQNWVINENAQTATLQLNKGKIAIIDLNDFPKIDALNVRWYYGDYVCANQKEKFYILHKEILNNPDGKIKFLNQNKADCRKANLIIK